MTRINADATEMCYKLHKEF